VLNGMHLQFRISLRGHVLTHSSNDAPFKAWLVSFLFYHFFWNTHEIPQGANKTSIGISEDVAYSKVSTEYLQTSLVRTLSSGPTDAESKAVAAIVDAITSAKARSWLSTVVLAATTGASKLTP
jgi:hypothetical protein